MKKIIFAIALLTACNAQEPVSTHMPTCSDNWDIGYDACIADITPDTDPPLATVDWQFRAELAEQLLQQARADLQAKENEYIGLHEHTTDLRDTLRYFDVAAQCDISPIDDWICTLAKKGDL